MPNIKLVGGARACTFSAWINPTVLENTINWMIIMTLGKWFTTNHNSYADFNVHASGKMISHVDPGTNTAASGYTRVVSDGGHQGQRVGLGHLRHRSGQLARALLQERRARQHHIGDLLGEVGHRHGLVQDRIGTE